MKDFKICFLAEKLKNQTKCIVMFLREPVKLYLVAFIFFVTAFSANALEVFTNEVPLEADKAFVVDHMMAGPNKVVIRWQISGNYYLYKEKFIFKSRDFYINDVNFPPATEKFDDFFGLSEVYFNLVETTLNISSKTSEIMNGFLEVGYQGCWEGGICYPLIRKSLYISEP